MTGSEIVRHRDMYQKLFMTMIGYLNMGLGPEDAVQTKPAQGIPGRIRRPFRLHLRRSQEHDDRLRAGLRFGARARQKSNCALNLVARAVSTAVGCSHARAVRRRIEHRFIRRRGVRVEQVVEVQPDVQALVRRIAAPSPAAGPGR